MFKKSLANKFSCLTPSSDQDAEEWQLELLEIFLLPTSSFPVRQKTVRSVLAWQIFMACPIFLKYLMKMVSYFSLESLPLRFVATTENLPRSNWCVQAGTRVRFFSSSVTQWSWKCLACRPSARFSCSVALTPNRLFVSPM